jgi:hypothetical protein
VSAGAGSNDGAGTHRPDSFDFAIHRESGMFADSITTFRPESLDRPQDELRDAFPFLTETQALGIVSHFAAIDAASSDLGTPQQMEHLTALFREMMRDAISAPQPRRRLREYRMALGWADPAEESMRRCATDYGVTVAGVSESITAIQRRFNLPRNLFNKSEEACGTYAKTNKTRNKHTT